MLIERRTRGETWVKRRNGVGEASESTIGFHGPNKTKTNRLLAGPSLNHDQAPLFNFSTLRVTNAIQVHFASTSTTMPPETHRTNPLKGTPTERNVSAVSL